MEIAGRLRKIRLEHKMTQQNIADVLGIDRTTYTFYETGATKPSLVTLSKLANIYNVTVGYLIGVEENHPERRHKPGDIQADAPIASSDPIGLLRKDERILLMCYRVLSDKDKQKVIENIKNYAVKTDESENGG